MHYIKHKHSWGFFKILLLLHNSGGNWVLYSSTINNKKKTTVQEMCINADLAVKLVQILQ